MRRSFFVAAIAALMLILTVVPAAATPPAEVEFESPVSFGGGGPFTATGPAVDSGLVCPLGNTEQLHWKATGFQAPTGVNFQVVKEFTCDDESGSFLVKLQVRADRKGVNFNWTILGGTGAYAKLHGSGQGMGLDPPEGFDILDLYSGKVHND